MPPARLKARMDSLLSFPVGLFDPLQHAGLSRRTPDRRQSSLNSESSPKTAQTTQLANSAQRIGRDDNGRSSFTVHHLLLLTSDAEEASFTLRNVEHFR